MHAGKKGHFGSYLKGLFCCDAKLLMPGFTLNFVTASRRVCASVRACMCGYIWLSAVEYSNTEWMLLQDIT